MPESTCQFSVVVPVYNSEKTLEDLCRRVFATFEIAIKKSFEIICVDDGSKDKSWQVLKTLHAKDSRIRIIRLSRNFGQHNAIMCGFRHAQGNYVITLDDDLQHPPEEITKMLACIQDSGADAVFGRPYKKEHSAFKNLGSRLIQKANQIIFGIPADLYVGSFRIIQRQLVEQLLLFHTPNPLIGPMILRNTTNVLNVEVEHVKRQYGRSNYKISKALKLTYDLFLNYSTIPLKIMSRMGFVVCGISLVWGGVLIFDKLFGFIHAPGWTSIMVMLLFVSSVNMIMFGFIGEYLARIIMEVSSSPQFIISEKYPVIENKT